MRSSLLFLLLLTAALHSSPPWGKDADLAFWKPAPPVVPKKYNVITRFALSAIRFHKRVLSPADGPRSHYYPSSSLYTRDAMQKYGFITGFFYGCDRLMRENGDSWVYPLIPYERYLLKHDPVR